MTIIAVDDKIKDLELISDLIYDQKPDDEILEFDDPLAALACARESRFDVAFIADAMSELCGMDLAVYLREINPYINIILVAQDKSLAYEALSMHVSGYIIKPATSDSVKNELDDLRYVSARVQKRVFVQTFGSFEVFVEGVPVAFKYQRTKEILAVLVNNRGAQTTNGEIIACLWEDDADASGKTSYLSNLRQDLQNTLKRLKADDIITKQRGSMAIVTDRIECDLYEWLKYKGGARNTPIPVTS